MAVAPAGVQSRVSGAHDTEQATTAGIPAQQAAVTDIAVPALDNARVLWRAETAGSGTSARMRRTASSTV
jgi:hypothetical protein